MQKRLNEEFRRHERVIHIFPSEESPVSLIGALLAEYNEAWQGRRYFDMDESNEWVDTIGEGNKDVALAS